MVQAPLGLGIALVCVCRSTGNDSDSYSTVALRLPMMSLARCPSFSSTFEQPLAQGALAYKKDYLLLLTQ